MNKTKSIIISGCYKVACCLLWIFVAIMQCKYKHQQWSNGQQMRIAQPNRNNYQASLNLRQEADGVFFLLTYAFLVKACSYEDHRRCITMFQSGQDSSEKRREGQLRGLQPKWWKCDNKQRRWPHTAVWHARWKVSGSHCRQYTVYDK